MKIYLESLQIIFSKYNIINYDFIQMSFSDNYIKFLSGVLDPDNFNNSLNILVPKDEIINPDDLVQNTFIHFDYYIVQAILNIKSFKYIDITNYNLLQLVNSKNSMLITLNTYEHIEEIKPAYHSYKIQLSVLRDVLQFYTNYIKINISDNCLFIDDYDSTLKISSVISRHKAHQKFQK